MGYKTLKFTFSANTRDAVQHTEKVVKTLWLNSFPVSWIQPLILNRWMRSKVPTTGRDYRCAACRTGVNRFPFFLSFLPPFVPSPWSLTPFHVGHARAWRPFLKPRLMFLCEKYFLGQWRWPCWKFKLRAGIFLVPDTYRWVPLCPNMDKPNSRI